MTARTRQQARMGTCERCDTPVHQRHGNLCAACIAEDMDYEPDDYDPDQAFLDFECGMMPDGTCTLAGSEDCDWECPRQGWSRT